MTDNIYLMVMDEKGNKANCKLLRSDQLSEILKKYNNHLKTSFDKILINDKPVELTKTPAQLGLVDGSTIRFAITKPEDRLGSKENEEKLQRRITELEHTVATLHNRIAEEEQKSLCSICIEHPKDTIIFPCLHLSYCNACLTTILSRNSSCPTCRTHVSGTLKINIGVS